MAGKMEHLSLANWRRATAEMYAAMRQANDPLLAHRQFVATRNDLFKNHDQSPLTAVQRASFYQLFYYPYDPAFNVLGHIDDTVEPAEFTTELSADGLFRLKRIAAIRFELLGQAAQLSLFWVQGYGGGLFLPFKDQTNRTETFGGGRYLYDTIKGADLGANEQEILLDFNFAYNPSCAYNTQWVCPLAPQENILNCAVIAGEKRFTLGDGD